MVCSATPTTSPGRDGHGTHVSAGAAASAETTPLIVVVPRGLRRGQQLPVQRRRLRRRGHSYLVAQQLDEFFVMPDGARGLAELYPAGHQLAVRRLVERLVRHGPAEGGGGSLMAAGRDLQPAGRQQRQLERPA